MFKRASDSLKPHLRRLHSQASSSARQNIRTSRGLAVVSTVTVGSVVWYTSPKIFNDASVALPVIEKAKKASSLVASYTDPDVLQALVWGSNSYRTISPDGPSAEAIRFPSSAKWLNNVALRDLAFHQKHAACVDAKGDVYQWGDGFFGGESSNTQEPKLTLRGKNILQLQLTESKLYALSASGRVYALATDASSQTLPPGAPTPASDSWWGTGWFWGEDETVDFTEITPIEKLGWGESFVSISAGQNHLLALTSKGRAFAHPVNKSANHYGQLGFRKFSIPDPASPVAQKAHLHVELIPKSLADPFANASRSVRVSAPSYVSDNLASIDDKSIRFCPNLFEISVLSGVDVAQVAAGGRSSFARTSTGRVLGWGANEYGQIGLGSNVALDTIIVPTEVILWKMVPSGTHSSCVDVTAGGDLSSFTVERQKTGSVTSTDLLMCGNGQHGGLGNNTFSNAQSNLVRAKNVSGLMQYNDDTKTLEAIKPAEVSISPTGHILLSLDSAASSGGVGGQDLMLWGKNLDSELGNGKRASLAVPNVLENSDGERLMLMTKKAKEVKDLKGNVWKRGVKVQQRAVTGYGCSAVYWKIAA